MLTYPDIDPVAIQLGPLSIHWYGIMYLVGFGAAFWLGNRRADRREDWTRQQVSDVVFYGALGAVVGGRIGYMLFYNLGNLLDNPLNLLRVWEGGMSFHGGFLGVLLAIVLFSRRYKKRIVDVMDFGAPLIPIGLGAGRIGNFIGGELWGRVTHAPWGMVFPGGGPLPRHPSQLYEAFLEGLVLFCILWWFSSRPRPAFSVAALFSLFYGSFRFFIEFFREPDEGISILFGWLTRGQLLSLPMILIGLLVLVLAYRYDTFGASGSTGNTGNKR